MATNAAPRRARAADVRRAAEPHRRAQGRAVGQLDPGDHAHRRRLGLGKEGSTIVWLFSLSRPRADVSFRRLGRSIAGRVGEAEVHGGAGAAALAAGHRHVAGGAGNRHRQRQGRAQAHFVRFDRYQCCCVALCQGKCSMSDTFPVYFVLVLTITGTSWSSTATRCTAGRTSRAPRSTTHSSQEPPEVSSTSQGRPSPSEAQNRSSTAEALAGCIYRTLLLTRA